MLELAKLRHYGGKNPGDLKVKNSHRASLMSQSTYTGRGQLQNKNCQASGQAFLGRYMEFSKSIWSLNHAGREGQKVLEPLQAQIPGQF